MARPLLGVGDYVCDLKLVMRVRLLFGLYNRLAVPKRFQIAAKLYCLLLLVYFIILLYFFLREIDSLPLSDGVTGFRYVYLIFNILWSMVTEDQFISSFCTRVNLTDVTVDSAIIFSRIERKIINILTGIAVGKIVAFLMFFVFLLNFSSVFAWRTVKIFHEDFSALSVSASNILVFYVLHCRLLVLRLKLQRYGFRSLRHHRLGTNNYCDMYIKIIEKLNENSGNIKTAVTIDIVFGTITLICLASFYIVALKNFWIMYIPVTLSVLTAIAPVLVYCAEMESVAMQVEAIRKFTASELIKQPCENSRRAMLELLALMAVATPHVSLCRSVRVDAALMLAVLSFCSARIILLLQLLGQ